MTERLDIEALRALVAISNLGGVTRAAEHLSLSQPAVSHKIKRLEFILDCKLLTRQTNGPLLTEAGSRLLSYSERIMDLHDEAVAALSKKPLTGKIRLGMTEDTTSGDVARILGRFTRLHPDIQVSTKIDQSLNLSDMLETGRIDIAVIQVLETDLRKDDILLYRDQLNWIKSHDLPLNMDAKIPFLSFDKHCFYRHWAQSECNRLGHQFRAVLECPSVAGILSATRAGLGVALINGLHLSSEIEVIQDVFPKPPAIAYVVRSRAKSRNDSVRALIKEILSEVGRSPSLKIA